MTKFITNDLKWPFRLQLLDASQGTMHSISKDTAYTDYCITMIVNCLTTPWLHNVSSRSVDTENIALSTFHESGVDRSLIILFPAYFV